MTVVRIQRHRTTGWRMPEGAVYVGRPSLFGNPWSLADAREMGVPEAERAAWCVRRYREELEHGGLLSDWSAFVSERRWSEMWDRWVTLAPNDPRSIRPLFADLLKDATALACWCHLDKPCHADVLIELLREAA